MHKFFGRRDEDFPFELPDRVYALLIDGEARKFVPFDADEADFFDQISTLPGFSGQQGSWRDHVSGAPIYSIEIKASDAPVSANWLTTNPRDALPECAEIKLVPHIDGEAAVYDNIDGPPVRATVSVIPLSEKLSKALQQATDLTPTMKSEAEIEQALPVQALENVFVLDVGQGSTNGDITWEKPYRTQSGQVASDLGDLLAQLKAEYGGTWDWKFRDEKASFIPIWVEEVAGS
ncbi:hypothetical protein ACC697_34625 [Rhizobium ruizarguesonis]|uniref:hypothetical protein n=1 Tax=Rhizobium johnstonii TaxID=3019933 RepID=UPI003F97C3C6